MMLAMARIATEIVGRGGSCCGSSAVSAVVAALSVAVVVVIFSIVVVVVVIIVVTIVDHVNSGSSGEYNSTAVEGIGCSFELGPPKIFIH